MQVVPPALRSSLPLLVLEKIWLEGERGERAGSVGQAHPEAALSGSTWLRRMRLRAAALLALLATAPRAARLGGEAVSALSIDPQVVLVFIDLIPPKRIAGGGGKTYCMAPGDGNGPARHPARHMRKSPGRQGSRCPGMNFKATPVLGRTLGMTINMMNKTSALEA